MSTLMFWNKQNSANSQQNSGDTKSGGKRNWLHAPDVLVNGHVAYLVKYLGSTPVEQAKGIEVVKEAIRRLQFAQQIKKSDSSSNVKTKKVEITVSIDGVAVQEPRTQTILHQFPLHKISYCADDKGVKKFFSFIAKTGNDTTNGDSTNSSSPSEDSHECFVFISNKLASDITLTIGQAFDLAYRRYMTDSGKVGEITKLQSENKMLERTVTAYRQRLKELAELVPKAEYERFVGRLGLKDIYEVAHENGVVDGHLATLNGNKIADLGIDVSVPHNDDQLLIETSPKHFAPLVPPRTIQNQLNSTLEALKPSIGTKLEGLLLNSDSDSDFDPRATEIESSAHANGNKITNDLFGFEPPKTLGQQLFAPTGTTTTTNGTNGITGFNPPPLLAPPPKAAVPRRGAPPPATNANNTTTINPLMNGNSNGINSSSSSSSAAAATLATATLVNNNLNNNNIINNNNMNNNMNSNNSQDLFGSDPFIPHASPFQAVAIPKPCNILSSTLNDTVTEQNEIHSYFTHTAGDRSFEDTGISMGDGSITDDDHIVSPAKHAIATFTKNSDHLDDILKHKVNDLSESLLRTGTGVSSLSSLSSLSSSQAIVMGTPSKKSDKPSSSSSSSSMSISNPFAALVSPRANPSLNELKRNDTATVTTKVSNPFGKSETAGFFTSSRPNYDALKNPGDFECSPSSSPPTIGQAADNSHTGGGDLFRDAAAVAFGEFGKSTEFCNQMTLAAAGAPSAGSATLFPLTDEGKNNFSKGLSFAAEDFTLESLDPLRKQ